MRGIVLELFYARTEPLISIVVIVGDARAENIQEGEARMLDSLQKHLTELIKQGIEHPGFSFLDVFSPCVTYNHDNTYQWFRPRVKKLEDDSAHDPTNWMAAMEKSLLW